MNTKYKFKHGQWFTATIDGEKCVGRVSIDSDGDIYLCQHFCEGSFVLNTLGFPSSWCIDNGSIKSLKLNKVKNLILLSKKPSSYIKPVVLPQIGSFRPFIINEGESIKIGCTKISRELYLEVGRKAGWIE